MDCDLMLAVKEHASTVRNRTGKVRFAKAMPTTNPRTGMLWERDWVNHKKLISSVQTTIQVLLFVSNAVRRAKFYVCLRIKR